MDFLCLKKRVWFYREQLLIACFLDPCFGWVPCFLVSRPFRSRDKFFVVVRSYSIYHLERFTRSNDVLTLDNVYLFLFVRIAWSCPTYIYP